MLYTLAHVMKLTDPVIKAAKPQEKAYTLSDGEGLVLHVQPNGSKWWRFRYRFNGKAAMLSLGVYPNVGLKAARLERDRRRRQFREAQPHSGVREDGGSLAAARDPRGDHPLVTDPVDAGRSHENKRSASSLIAGVGERAIAHRRHRDDADHRRARAEGTARLRR